MRLGSVAKTLFALVVVNVFVCQASATPCVIPPLSRDAIEHFKANPQALVAPGTDTRTVEATVRDLAGTDAALSAELVNLAKGSNPRTQTAIAAGLAQAAVACQTVDQRAALQIQQAVADFQDGEFQNVFAAVAGDLSTAAVNAANDAAVGSVGSVVVTNPTTSRAPTTNFGAGGTPAFFQITASPPITNTPTPSSSSSTTKTAATPVSPTR